jgi:hypothetical protein
MYNAHGSSTALTAVTMQKDRSRSPEDMHGRSNVLLFFLYFLLLLMERLDQLESCGTVVVVPGKRFVVLVGFC